MALSPRHCPWYERGYRPVTGQQAETTGWAVAPFTAIFPEIIDQLPKTPLHFPPDRLVNFFSSKEFLPNLPDPVHGMANLRVGGTLNSHPVGYSSPFGNFPLAQGAWGGHLPSVGGLPMTGACHLKGWSRPLFFSSSPYSTLNCSL